MLCFPFHGKKNQGRSVIKSDEKHYLQNFQTKKQTSGHFENLVSCDLCTEFFSYPVEGLDVF